MGNEQRTGALPALLKTALLTATLLLSCCGKNSSSGGGSIDDRGLAQQQGPLFYPEENPSRLSQWGLFSLGDGALQPAVGTEVFVPANQLFSDYASKLRTIWLPDGTPAPVVDGEYDYPIGTVLSKTFYYPVEVIPAGDAESSGIDLATHRLLETRLLVKRAGGWEALAYVWDEQEQDAYLRVAGDVIPLELHRHTLKQPPVYYIADVADVADSAAAAETGTEFTYFVPDRNQCAACHVISHPDGGLQPLAATVRQLRQRPATISYDDPAADLHSRAIEYLNINCGHCHNPQGSADTSALVLTGEHVSAAELGVCKPPVAAGGGSGDRRFSIVPGDPEGSILLYRMRATALDEMMPELGRSLPHAEGIRLISEWIAAMPGDCEVL